MAIYCNVEKCGYWKAIDEPVQQSHGIGYVPIGGLGLYKGTCGLNSVSVHPKTVKSGTGARTVLSICSNFSESAATKQDSLDVSMCSQDTCRYNREVDGSFVCERLNLPDTDVFFDTVATYDGAEKVVFPVCKSYSTNHRSDVIDWSRAYETS